MMTVTPKSLNNPARPAVARLPPVSRHCRATIHWNGILPRKNDHRRCVQRF